MIKPRLYKWELNDDTIGLLFFAQALEELLFHYTIDSFKAPALNTHLNVIELVFLAREFKRGRIKSATIIPVIEELEHRMKKDPIITERKDVFIEYMGYIRYCVNNADELLTSSEALLAEMNIGYWTALKSQIIQTVNNTKEKRKILNLATILTAEVELRGFSRYFLYFMTLNFFFNWHAPPVKITSSSQVENFLAIFEGDEIEWEIIYRGSRLFDKYKDYAKPLDFQIISSLPAEIDAISSEQPLLKHDEKYPFYIYFAQVKANDRFVASKRANSAIELFADICRFHDHINKPVWKSKCLVRRKGETEFFPVKPPPPPMTRGTTTRIITIEDIENNIEIIYKYFKPESIRLFIKAMDYHRTAIETTDSESQLVSLWSSLEGFLPTPKEDSGQAKILQYSEYILPPLTLTYSEKMFKYISDTILHSGNEIKEHINNLKVEGSFFDKVVCILVSVELEEERKKLFELLKSNPLLRFKCFWYNDNFNSNMNIKNIVTVHKQRVHWHIQRIYTMRNLIVHSATTLPYLGTLVENLHTYFDILMASVIKIGNSKQSRISIKSALRMLQMHEKSFVNGLKGDKIKCTLENYKQMVFGKNNPLSPYN